MLLQQRHAAEGARADAALVLFHLGVGLEMSPQVGAVRKGPVAVGAGERTLTWTEKVEKTMLHECSSQDFFLSSQELFINTHTHTQDNEETHDRLVGSQSD